MKGYEFAFAEKGALLYLVGWDEAAFVGQLRQEK
jgi:hypothetical protein